MRPRHIENKMGGGGGVMVGGWGWDVDLVSL